MKQMIAIKPSLIPEADLGAFTTQSLPKGTYLGHYGGRLLRPAKFVRIVFLWAVVWHDAL